MAQSPKSSGKATKKAGKAQKSAIKSDKKVKRKRRESYAIYIYKVSSVQLVRRVVHQGLLYCLPSSGLCINYKTRHCSLRTYGHFRTDA